MGNPLDYSRLNGQKNYWDAHYVPPNLNLEKWWYSLVLGMVFAIISSGSLYRVSSLLTTKLGALPTMYGSGPNIGGLLLHSFLFVLIARFLLG